jgi:hypothetical protein
MPEGVRDLYFHSTIPQALHSRRLLWFRCPHPRQAL